MAALDDFDVDTLIQGLTKMKTSDQEKEAGITKLKERVKGLQKQVRDLKKAKAKDEALIDEQAQELQEHYAILKEKGRASAMAGVFLLPLVYGGAMGGTVLQVVLRYGGAALGERAAVEAALVATGVINIYRHPPGAANDSECVGGGVGGLVGRDALLEPALAVVLAALLVFACPSLALGLAALLSLQALLLGDCKNWVWFMGNGMLVVAGVVCVVVGVALDVAGVQLSL